MKKILAAILISIMALGLIGCGKKEQTKVEDETQKNEQTTEAVTEADTKEDEDAATEAEDEEKEDNENNGNDSENDLRVRNLPISLLQFLKKKSQKEQILKQSPIQWFQFHSSCAELWKLKKVS